jgi:hypothetical protein
MLMNLAPGVRPLFIIDGPFPMKNIQTKTDSWCIEALVRAGAKTSLAVRLSINMRQNSFYLICPVSKSLKVVHVPIKKGITHNVFLHTLEGLTDK